MQMRCLARFSIIAVLALYACGGGGSGGTAQIPQSANGTTPSSEANSVQLGLQPTSVSLPIVSQITGTLFFPAVTTPTTLELSASASAPAGVALESVRRMQQQSGTLTVYESFTLVPVKTVTLPNIPAVTLNFPATTAIAGKSFSYGISDLNAQGGLVSFDTQGPGTISGQTVSFALVPTPITFVAGHKYTFVVYATASMVSAGASKIYVVNFGQFQSHNITPGSITSYTADGSPTTPMITSPSAFVGIAIDAIGKIYVSTGFDPIGTVTTYKMDGTPTTPTLFAGLSGPTGVAVDAAGKIYVVDAINNRLTTYEADGTRTSPTITAGLSAPVGVAVDAAGKIYVASQNNVLSTYNADGTRTTPTITTGLSEPTAVAVDAAGKIYVTNWIDQSVTTYNADGNRTTPTITGLTLPTGIAVR